MKKKFFLEIEKDSCGGISFSTNEHCDSKDLLESLLSISKNLESSIEMIHEIETGSSCAGEANLENCVPYCYGGSYCIPAGPETCAAYCPGGEYCIPASQENCIPFINEQSCNLYMPPYYKYILTYLRSCEQLGGEVACEVDRHSLDCYCIC